MATGSELVTTVTSTSTSCSARCSVVDPPPRNSVASGSTRTAAARAIARFSATRREPRVGIRELVHLGRHGAAVGALDVPGALQGVEVTTDGGLADPEPVGELADGDGVVGLQHLLDLRQPADAKSRPARHACDHARF